MLDEVKLSPYVYHSEMQSEQEEDQALEFVQALCKFYIANPTEFGDFYVPDEVFLSHKFVLTKITELNETKFNLKIVTKRAPFVRIGHNLDLITMSNELATFNLRSVYIELATQIDLTMEILNFCLITLNKIIYTRKEQ